MYPDSAAVNSVLHMYRHMKLQPTVRMIVNIHLYSVFIELKAKLKTRTKPTEGERTQLDWLGSHGSVQLALSSRVFNWNRGTNKHKKTAGEHFVVLLIQLYIQSLTEAWKRVLLRINLKAEITLNPWPRCHLWRGNIISLTL